METSSKKVSFFTSVDDFIAGLSPSGSHEEVYEAFLEGGLTGFNRENLKALFTVLGSMPAQAGMGFRLGLVIVEKWGSLVGELGMLREAGNRCPGLLTELFVHSDEFLTAETIISVLSEFPSAGNCALSFSSIGSWSLEQIFAVYDLLPPSRRPAAGKKFLGREDLPFEFVYRLASDIVEGSSFSSGYDPSLVYLVNSKHGDGSAEGAAVLRRLKAGSLVGELKFSPVISSRVGDLPFAMVLALSETGPGEKANSSGPWLVNFEVARELVESTRVRVGEEFWSAFSESWSGSFNDFVDFFDTVTA